MTATKKTVGPPIDLRGDSDWKRRRDAAVSEVGKLAPAPEEAIVEAPELSVRASRKPLLQRRMAIDITYLDPDTGETLNARIVSEVPGENELNIIAADTRRRLNYAPPSTWPEWQVLRASCLATCLVQIVEAPDWFGKRLCEDNGLMLEVHGRLAEHSNGYFQGKYSQSEGDSEKPRLAVSGLLDIS